MRMCYIGGARYAVQDRADVHEKPMIVTKDAGLREPHPSPMHVKRAMGEVSIMHPDTVGVFEKA